jgi:SAM-dependent methyltransferase
MKDIIVNPDTKSPCVSISENCILFEDGSSLPVFNSIPILFGRSSIFSAQDILNFKKTTQDKRQHDTSRFRNYIRKKLVPSLTKDFNINKRYDKVSQMISPKGRVLIVGAGDKGNYYRNKFSDCEVIISDVHNEFNPDLIFDGHFMPFKDNSFDLVLAGQVIEHTINPWIFSKELERVTKTGGILQIEAPHNFPYHAPPYDFFRFTFTGIRSLFSNCKVLEVNITEGNSAILAVTLSNWLVNFSNNRVVRIFITFLSGFAFGWLKYLDSYKINKRTISNPKGFAFTFQKDDSIRSSRQLLEEYYDIS